MSFVEYHNKETTSINMTMTKDLSICIAPHVNRGPHCFIIICPLDWAVEFSLEENQVRSGRRNNEYFFQYALSVISVVCFCVQTHTHTLFYIEQNLLSEFAFLYLHVCMVTHKNNTEQLAVKINKASVWHINRSA